MRIQLSDHFDYKRLLRFTFPSMVMMVFTSLYSVVDGFFVSNFVGKTPFAAVNFIMPVLMILGSVGFMFGSGGSALVSKTMGEGKPEKARELFSLFIYSTAVCGIIIAVISFLFLRPLAALMGAEGEMLDNCVLYGRILLLSLPFYMLQFEFQSFFITAERPQMGLVVTVVCGLTNMVLDALFMAFFSWGLVGAAAATAVSQILGGFIPILFFCRADAGTLRLTKTKIDGKALLKACTNGSSELMSNISMSIVSILYNFQLMRYAGENGIAIYGSSFFTALNDGLTSALISFLRSLLFQVAAVIILPLIFGIDGIWFSVVAAELVAAVMTVLFIAAKKGKYQY